MTGINRTAIALLAFALSTPLVAQKWRDEQVPDCGIEFQAPDRLERLPLQLGNRDSSLRARLVSKDESDLIRGVWQWACEVRAFDKKDLDPEDVKLPDGLPDEAKEQLRKFIANDPSRARNFEDWLDKQKTMEVLERGKQVKRKGKKLAHKKYAWVVENGYGPVGVTYYEASVYEFEERDVALVMEMPLEKRKPLKPKSKWAKLIKRMLKNTVTCEAEAEDEADTDRDKYADTPERKAALEAAKANIAGLKGWDYFTLPNYIVLYSWDFEKQTERRKSLKQARFYADRLEKMRELYLSNYPLDETGTKAIMPDPSTVPGLNGPVTGADAAAKKAKTEARLAEKKKVLGKKPYSVFRLCATEDQFQKYGQSPNGVVGWYSPSSKELVVFLGGDKRMGKGATETVTYHEGWHQYADFYFHPPESEKHASLHRWFDEGHGDYFGSFRWGKSGWKYVGSKMRNTSCKQMVRQEDYVPFKEIVRWPRRLFYGENAPYYYAQAFAMIDFLRRGEQHCKDWQPRWGQVLDIYRKVALIKGNTELAVDLAFRGWEDKDFLDLEEAWKDWVKGSRFPNGR